MNIYVLTFIKLPKTYLVVYHLFLDLQKYGIYIKYIRKRFINELKI